MKKLKQLLILSSILLVSWLSYSIADEEILQYIDEPTENLYDLASSNQIINEQELYWIITKIENWKDWRQIYFINSQGTEYTTAVSVIMDEIIWWKLDDLNVWAVIDVYYTDTDNWMNLLIWNKVKILSTATNLDKQQLLISKLKLSSVNNINKFILKFIENWFNKKLSLDNLVNQISKIQKQYYSSTDKSKMDIYLSLELLKYKLTSLN
jgi:hypothetical protein